MNRPVYGGTAGGVSANSPTPGFGVGFGMGDFNRAMSDGYGAQSIINYLSTWNPLGPRARTALTSTCSLIKMLLITVLPRHLRHLW